MGSDFSQVAALAVDLGRTSTSVAARTAVEIRRSGGRLRDLAQSGAPVLTGALQGSVDASITALRATVTADDEASYFQEYGTSRHGPQPFMAPAAEAVIPDFEAVMARIAEEGLP